MGNLGEDPHAVAHLSGGVLAGAVLQLLNDVQGIVHHPVVLTPVDIDDSSDAAGIMFELCIHMLGHFFQCVTPLIQQKRKAPEGTDPTIRTFKRLCFENILYTVFRFCQ